MLKENDEFKKRQQEELQREREQDIKFMDEYTRILDKQEHDRADYFKKCESRQLECMNRMAETVVKQQDNKFREEEEKLRTYQMEKDRRYTLINQQRSRRGRQKEKIHQRLQNEHAHISHRSNDSEKSQQ